MMSRRRVLKTAAAASVGVALGSTIARADADGQKIKDDTFAFIRKCVREDGGYAPSPDPKYLGNSDTGLSDLAAVTYAATLAKTVGWELPDAKKSAEFVHKHQQPDGRFVNLGGKMKAEEDLAILYNTTQGVVALRALGQKPNVDPAPVMKRFFEQGAIQKLPWYTTSFFPLCYAAIEQPFPAEYQKALSDYMVSHQAEDGYLQDHIAAAFHMAHFYRLVREETPRGQQMLQRALKDQTPEGGWNIREPDWDVHACFDAVFVLRQLGTAAPASNGIQAKCRDAIAKAAAWALSCRNPDGGFGHYPKWHSDMDAVYFQFGTLIQAERIPGARFDLPDGHTLSWGHAMRPGKRY
ncbi:MAG TPA: prenyltransferase/squalene oxidase repeat-containing protein [Planctomycetota bacterium]|jgi:geranylgeranyl transferase type-2 subunit beta